MRVSSLGDRRVEIWHYARIRGLRGIRSGGYASRFLKCAHRAVVVLIEMHTD